VQALAAWLVARPQNAVIALAATLLLPLLQMVSGVIMVLLVLTQGARIAVFEGAVAGVILALVALVTGSPLNHILVATLSTWVPAIMLALVLQTTRSLTLTLQVSVLVAALAVVGFYIVIDDMVAYWDPVMTVLLEWTRGNNLQEQAQLMESDPVMTANMLTMAIVLSSWMLYTVYLVFGYWLYRLIPGESGDYGRFSDLNFGRVIALIMALLSLLAFVTGAAWLQSVAFVLFAVFWLQGLAVVHWLHSVGNLPLLVVIMTYVLLPFLHVFLIMRNNSRVKDFEMNVILLDNVENLGNIGDLVKVKAGYGRNFLIPQGKAALATPENVKAIDARRAELEKAASADLVAAQARAKTLTGLELVITANAGSEDKLFGSVGPVDIVEALEKVQVQVERSEVRMPDGPIHELGDYPIGIHLHSEVDAEVSVRVISSD
jgi:large subunit ribosomal protein L9